MSHSIFSKLYHSTQIEYLKNGIYIRFLDDQKPDPTLIFHKFIQIKTIGSYPQLKYKACTNEETKEYQAKVQKHRDRYTSGRITPVEFMEQLNKFRNRAIHIERPLISVHDSKNWMFHWKSKRIQKDIEQNLVALLNHQIKVQLLSLDPSNHRYLLLNQFSQLHLISIYRTSS